MFRPRGVLTPTYNRKKGFNFRAFPLLLPALPLFFRPLKAFPNLILPQNELVGGSAY